MEAWEAKKKSDLEHFDELMEAIEYATEHCPGDTNLVANVSPHPSAATRAMFRAKGYELSHGGKYWVISWGHATEPRSHPGERPNQDIFEVLEEKNLLRLSGASAFYDPEIFRKHKITLADLDVEQHLIPVPREEKSPTMWPLLTLAWGLPVLAGVATYLYQENLWSF